MLTFGLLPPWASTPNRSSTAAAAAAAPVAAAGAGIAGAAAAPMRNATAATIAYVHAKKNERLVVANTAYKSSVSTLWRIVAKKIQESARTCESTNRTSHYLSAVAADARNMMGKPWKESDNSL